MEVIKSILNTIYNLVRGRLKFPEKYLGKTIQMDNGLTLNCQIYGLLYNKDIDKGNSVA